MNTLDRLLSWCEQEAARLRRTIPLLEAEEIVMREREGSSLVDTTPADISQMKAALVEIEEIAARLRARGFDANRA